MPDFGIFRGFNEKLFGDKLYAGQLPIHLGMVRSDFFLGLLDLYPNAAAAYSLRKLRSRYTGSAIRVRRASDNTELDIGFLSNQELDTSALNTFCSGTNGFVKTWYDQSGNARNATQTTAANQPQIVSGGNVILQNSKPIVLWNNNNNLLVGNLSALTIGELFLVTKSLNPSNGFIKFGGDISLSNHYPFTDGNIYDGFGSSNRKSTGSPVVPINQLNIYNVLTAPNSWQSRINTLLQFSTTSNTVAFSTTSTIGQPGTFNYIGSISELILYPSNESSNRSAITTSINNFYTIF
jgi:hypothetical protein